MINKLDFKRIEDAKTFDEIAQIRDLTFRVNEASGFDLQSLLTGGYKDPTHFIYELIQNAEDAKAEKVEFLLYSDKKDKFKKSYSGFDYFECNIRNKDGIAASYLLFERALSIDERLFVSIAYRVEDEEEGRSIVMETGTTKLVVFFPMDGILSKK